MAMVAEPAPDPDDRFLSTLSKVPWCVDILRAIARKGSCSLSELYRVSGTSAARPNQTNDEAVDRYLSLLKSLQLVEQVEDTFKITARGAATAARLDPARATRHQQQPELSPVAEPEEPADHGIRASIPRASTKSPDSSVGADQTPSRRRKYAASFVLVACLLIVLGWNFVGANTSGASAYRFANVERGDLRLVTLSTGQIEAINAVEVSSQLSGQVVALHANFNDKVTAGAPLAQLDDKSFVAAVAEAKAQLAHAVGSHDAAVAKIAGAEARDKEAQQFFERKQTLAAKGSISAQEIDQARAKLATAESERDAARADEAIQKAAIDMATAALRKAEIALERTVIRSPIDGIVIRRSIELGQTVAVSMEAPTLFTIARDLTEMRVHARVDEADIGQIKAGQKASFSVSAYPDRIFSGEVVEVHRAPEAVQNVVTYKVVITAQNPDLALLPGMTALVRIATIERTDALLVPNAALRFEPETGASPAPPRDESVAGSAGQPAQVWVRSQYGGLSRVDIGIGVSDGSMTEVVSGSLSDGQAVAIGKQVAGNERTFLGIRLGF